MKGFKIFTSQMMRSNFLMMRRFTTIHQPRSLETITLELKTLNKPIDDDKFGEYLQQILRHSNNAHKDLQGSMSRVQEALQYLLQNYELNLKKHGFEDIEKEDEKTQQIYPNLLALQSKIYTFSKNNEDMKAIHDKLNDIGRLHLQQKDMVEIVQAFQQITKFLSAQNVPLDPICYNQLKEAFLRECKESGESSDKFSHSLTYFLFLSVKNKYRDQEIYKYVISNLYGKPINLDTESTIILLFTLSRIEKLVGRSEFQNKLDKDQMSMYQYFIREQLHKRMKTLQEYFEVSPQTPSEKLSKISMLAKALTFNKQITEDNFDPYIVDILDVIVKITSNILQSQMNIDLITQANILQTFCFDVHFQNKKDKITKKFLSIDKGLYQCLLENIFIKLNEQLQDPKHDVTIVIFSLRSYIYYLQARNSLERGEEATAEYLVKCDDLLQQIYSSIVMQILNHFDQFSISDLIKVIFEMSQKKVLPPYFVNDLRVQKLLKNMNFEELSTKNRQDFLSIGHILHNTLIYSTLPPQIVDKYKEVLIAKFLGNHNEKEANDEAQQQLQQKIKKPSQMSQQELEKFHANKVLGKLKKRRHQNDL